MRRDIDMEVTRDIPNIAAGFLVMADLAQLPGVRQVRYATALDELDQGLSWQVRYRDLAARPILDWTIDIWLLPHHHPGPRSMDLVGPMLAVMTPEIRMTIPRLKDHVQDHPTVTGVDLYRAVIDGDVRSPEELEQWGALNEDPGLTDWRPRP